MENQHYPTMLESSGDKAPPDVVTDIFPHLDGIKQSSMMESVKKKVTTPCRMHPGENPVVSNIFPEKQQRDRRIFRSELRAQFWKYERCLYECLQHMIKMARNRRGSIHLKVSLEST